MLFVFLFFIKKVRSTKLDLSEHSIHTSKCYGNFLDINLTILVMVKGITFNL